MGTGLSFLPVYGHASPATYSPTPNQVIDSTQSLPDKITITFTERPELRASNIEVINSNNERIDNNDLNLGDSDKALSASIDKSKLVSGIYTVNWLVLSKDDGHITRGSYVFSVAESNSQSQLQQQQNITNASSGYSKNITTADDISLNFDINPFHAGPNTFNLSASYTNGTAVENIRDVYLEFNNPIKNLGPIVDTMEKVDSGKYSLVGNYLSQNGNWEIKMTVQRMGGYDINQQFDVEIK
jgi:methionine-rich copper-binding protein CopC